MLTEEEQLINRRGKAKNFTVSLYPLDLTHLDELAKSEGVGRSEMLRRLVIEEYMAFCKRNYKPRKRKE